MLSCATPPCPESAATQQHPKHPDTCITPLLTLTPHTRDTQHTSYSSLNPSSFLALSRATHSGNPSTDTALPSAAGEGKGRSHTPLRPSLIRAALTLGGRSLLVDINPDVSTNSAVGVGGRHSVGPLVGWQRLRDVEGPARQDWVEILIEVVVPLLPQHQWCGRALGIDVHQGGGASRHVQVRLPHLQRRGCRENTITSSDRHGTYSPLLLAHPHLPACPPHSFLPLPQLHSPDPW